MRNLKNRAYKLRDELVSVEPKKRYKIVKREFEMLFKHCTNSKTEILKQNDNYHFDFETLENVQEYFYLLLRIFKAAQLTMWRNEGRGDEVDQYRGSDLGQKENYTWTTNHEKIREAVRQYISDNETLPTKTEIAHLAKLSRVTIDKHFKELDFSSFFAANKDVTELLRTNVLGKLAKLAIREDDVKAMSTFLKYTTPSKQRVTNNFIQINNTVLDASKLAELTAEQLNVIELIINNQVPNEQLKQITI